MTGKRGKRRKQLRDGLNLKKTRGYWKLKEDALSCTLCRTGLGRDYGPVAIQSAEWRCTLCSDTCMLSSAYTSTAEPGYNDIG